MEIFDGNCYPNVTADRINNLHSHVTDNIILLCDKCNCCRFKT